MLTRFIILLLPLLFCSSLRSQVLVFKDVQVVDVESGTIKPGQTVMVQGGIITAVGSKVKWPAHAIIIPGTGKYLIPGLWDMHAHVAEPKRAYQWSLLLAYGVTGVRDMGGLGLEELNQSKQRIREGVLGPRIYGAGKVLDGKPAVAPEQGVEINSAEEATLWVDQMAEGGADFIKSYEMLRPENFQALVRAARKRGLKVAGHVPLTMTVAEAAGSLHSMEHLRGFDYACSPLEDSIVRLQRHAIDTTRLDGRSIRAKLHGSRFSRAHETYDTNRATALAQVLSSRQVFQAPTLIIGMNTLVNTRFDTTAGYKKAIQYMPDSVVQQWQGLFQPRAATEQERNIFSFRNRMVRLLKAHKVPIMAGTDVILPFLVPGYSLHQELEMLVKAGLTPAEALQAATLTAARCLGLQDKAGAIKVGYWADLVLLE
ncbi:MAG TPA: amidohydrolase family protein, partial [Chitinophagaceae bacterium]|nr:amidohydrolase family protein [Chitinophagaceae bacterium]